jgi:hypothetical protein
LNVSWLSTISTLELSFKFLVIDPAVGVKLTGLFISPVVTGLSKTTESVFNSIPHIPERVEVELKTSFVIKIFY